jgi:hypothetical protein
MYMYLYVYVFICICIYMYMYMYLYVYVVVVPGWLSPLEEPRGHLSALLSSSQLPCAAV